MASPRRSQSHHESNRIALCGVVVALSVTLMLTAGLIPVTSYAAPLYTALLLIPILLEYGTASAWLVYLSVSLICIFLGVDKEAAFFYLFIGYYPIIKPRIDHLKFRPLRFVIKALLFNLSIAGMYAFLTFILHMDAIAEEFQEFGKYSAILFFVLFNLCFFIYDFLINPLVIIYIRKIRPRFRFTTR